MKVLKAAAAAAINTRVVGLACKNHEGCADWCCAHREFRGCAEIIFFPGQIGDGAGISAKSTGETAKRHITRGPLTRNFCHGQIGKGLFAPRHFGEVLGHFGSATGEKAFSREIPGTPRWLASYTYVMWRQVRRSEVCLVRESL